MKMHASFVAAIALSFVALGQEPKDDDVVDVKVIGPEVHAIELDDVDLAEIVPMDDARGSFILGVKGKTQDDQKKPGKKQDDRKDRRIEKEIDLGNGQTLKLSIRVTGGKDSDPAPFHPFGGDRPMPKRRGIPKALPSDGSKGPGQAAPRVFEFGGERAGAMESVERAVRAFERAREAFMKALKEGEARVYAAERRAAAGAKPDRERRVYVEKLKAGEDDDRKVEVRMKPLAGADVQVLGVTPGAAATQAREIDGLRKEIKELEKMVRELKEQLSKKGE